MDATIPQAAKPATTTAPMPTATIIVSVLQSAANTSDLIFSPGRAPQAETNGQLVQVKIPGVGILTSEDTARIAGDLIGRNALAVEKLKSEGSCDISYSLTKVARFRVNIFTCSPRLRLSRLRRSSTVRLARSWSSHSIQELMSSAPALSRYVSAT